MNFVLDTNTVSYYFKGNPYVVRKLLARTPQEIFIPAVVIYEIEYGIGKSTAPEKKRSQFEALLARCSIVDFTGHEARVAADIRRALESRGTPIGPYDILIAASALAHGHTLVTHNTTEFKRVAGLRVVDWFKA